MANNRRIEQWREEQSERRHIDLLSCSIMTLMTIGMGGLFAFVRTALVPLDINLTWNLVQVLKDIESTEIAAIGTIASLMAYLGSIWGGMRVLRNNGVLGKAVAFAQFRGYCIFVILVIAATITAGILTETGMETTPPSPD